MDSVQHELLAGLTETWLPPEAAELEQQLKDDWASVEALLSDWTARHSAEIADRYVRELTCAGSENRWEAVVRSAAAGDTDWMRGYGLPITEAERTMAAFWFRYPPERVQHIAEHIVSAFLHGFLSQSRDRRGRTHVRMYYCVGQEALVQAVLRVLDARGLRPILLRPRCLSRSGAYAMKHSADRAACLSEKSLAALLDALAAAYDRYATVLSDTCGMIGIDQFGARGGVAQMPPEQYQPSAARRARLASYEDFNRRQDARYLAPSDISFCKIAFPNALFGASLPPLFDAFYALNTMDSDCYERLQQMIIDILDACCCIRVSGAAGNQTELSIRTRLPEHPEVQTAYLNCGGDLNVPHGELFTTPLLTGTNGTLHVQDIYLRDVYFPDLILRFTDGYITDYACGGFDTPEAGRAYVREHLLQGHDTLTIGEFAIGSNTLAYRIAKEHDLFSRLPILLLEKMGPHIAVGDPCFARGEDAPIRNLLDHKQMCARENERTARRHEDLDVYYNVHTDITLPYEQLAALIGVRPDDTEVAIIREGRFVLPGTEALNEPLERSASK